MPYDPMAAFDLMSADIEAELAKRGFTDHNDLRDFAIKYGKVIAEMQDEETVAALIAASMVGGFLLGLDYCTKQKRGGAWR